MKKITVLIISIFLLAGKINSQPTLTSSTNNPIVGDFFTQNQTTYENPGSSGANVTWDFSNLFAAQSLAYTYLLPSATPYASLFTNANIAASVNNGSTPYYYYFQTNSSSFSIAGIYIPSQSASLPYTNPENLLQYPMTYNTSYTDNFALTVSGYDRHGNINVTADAYGTLIMPYGTITNVLRVKAIETYADYISGNPVTNYVSTNYYWYKPGIHNSIFQVSSLKVNGSTYQEYGLFIDGSSVGIHDITSNLNKLNFYPNPAIEKITIDIPFQINKTNSLIIISDINGKELKKLEVSQNTDKLEIDIRSLNSGIYFIKYITKNQITIEKFFKQ